MADTSSAYEFGPTQGIATYRDYLVMRLFETSGLSASSSTMDRDRSPDELAVRDARWSEAVAVGSLAFVEKIKGIHRSNGKFFPRILDDATRFESS
jgi:hypothetical protein